MLASIRKKRQEGDTRSAGPNIGRDSQARYHVSRTHQRMSPRKSPRPEVNIVSPCSTVKDVSSCEEARGAWSLGPICGPKARAGRHWHPPPPAPRIAPNPRSVAAGRQRSLRYGRRRSLRESVWRFTAEKSKIPVLRIAFPYALPPICSDSFPHGLRRW